MAALSSYQRNMAKGNMKAAAALAAKISEKRLKITSAASAGSGKAMMNLENQRRRRGAKRRSKLASGGNRSSIAGVGIANALLRRDHSRNAPRRRKRASMAHIAAIKAPRCSSPPQRCAHRITQLRAGASGAASAVRINAATRKWRALPRAVPA